MKTETHLLNALKAALPAIAHARGCFASEYGFDISVALNKPLNKDCPHCVARAAIERATDASPTAGHTARVEAK
jgi:hypothetical protein